MPEAHLCSNPLPRYCKFLQTCVRVERDQIVRTRCKLEHDGSQASQRRPLHYETDIFSKPFQTLVNKRKNGTYMTRVALGVLGSMLGPAFSPAARTG